MNNEIYFIELIGLQFFLGSIVYLCAIIATTLILIKKKKKLFNIILIDITHFVFSVLISLLIWSDWSWEIDIMFLGFLNIPALIGEVVSILTYYVLRIFSLLYKFLFN